MKKIIIVAMVICLFLPYTLAEIPNTIDDYIILYNTWSLTTDSLSIEECVYDEVERGIYNYSWIDDDRLGFIQIMPMDNSVIMSYTCSDTADIGRFFNQSISIIRALSIGKLDLNDVYTYLISNYINLKPNEQGESFDFSIEDAQHELAYGFGLCRMSRQQDFYRVIVMTSYNPYYDD